MTSFRVGILSPEGYQTWFERNYSDLCCRSPFHHPAWLEAVSRGVRFDLRFIGIYDGNDLVAAVPGFLTRRGPFWLFGSPLRGLMTSYLGPTGLNVDDCTEQFLNLIEPCSHFARQRWRTVYTRFTLRNAPAAGRPEQELNWKRQRARSYRLDLTKGEAALWNQLESDCRRNIRKAERLEIETVPFDNAHHFYQMLNDTFKRHGTVSWHSEQFFQLLFTELVPRDLMWAWGAKYEGNVIAAGLFLHDDQEVHFVSGASLPQYGSLPTSYLLHWRAIEEGVRHGLRVFNSDASRIRSIDQFKESFRPALERRYILMWAPEYVRSAQKVFLTATHHWRQVRSRL